MKIVTDEESYELVMIDYQISEITRLNEVLQRRGIDDEGLRKAICGDFAAVNGAFLDRGWIEKEGAGRYWPELLFSRRALDPKEGLGPMSELVVPQYASNFEGYAFGAVQACFEEQHESRGPVVTGNL